MDWTNDTVLRFLELYRTHSCIWDPKHESHKSKNRLSDAWLSIRSTLGEPYTVKDLKRKKESLMSAYRGYRNKIEKSGDQYKPTWFAFTFMDSFLGNVYRCPTSVKTEVQCDEDDSDDLEILEHGSTNQTARTTTARKPHDSPDLQQSRKHTDLLTPKDPLRLFNIQKSVPQKRQNADEDDECCIFAKLIEKKMRRLPEDRRDFMMFRINELFYKECHTRPRADSFSSGASYNHTPSPSRIQHDDSLE